MARLPAIQDKHKICIICEGFEEKVYIDRLVALNLWQYAFTVINVKGASRISARFQSLYNNNAYEMILIFCDTDKAPFRSYEPVKRSINNFLGKRKAAEKLIIFANPCTMQIILSHFGDVSLMSPSKKVNASIIERCTGVANYDAKDEQIQEICSKINRRNYEEMKNRIRFINRSDDITPSTNCIVFLDRFESKDAKWISEINKFI